MNEFLKSRLKKSLLYRSLVYYRQKSMYHKWLFSGKIGPPPHIYKQMVVREYRTKFKLNTFIETGTYLGDMVNAMRNDFSEIYSIELDKNLYVSAVKRFSNCSHISILQGDSGNVLPYVVCKATQPCLFWLDGHYSEGITAKGESETPIRKELECILRSSVNNHVVLIDDARLFVGRNDYPTIKDLKEYLLKERPDLVFEVVDDIIRIHPKI